MPIRIRCRCGKALVASRRHAGQVARCPKCKQRIRIPSATKPVSSPPQPAAANKTPGPADSQVATAAKGSGAPAQAARSEAAGQRPDSSQSAGSNRARTTRGVEHDPGKRLAVAWLAVVFGLVAIIGGTPSIWQLASQIQNAQGPQLENWATVLLLLSTVQLAYAIYLYQLPDWSSVRVVSLVAMLSAGPYAALLGIGLRARHENPIVQWLGLSPQLVSGQATGWSLLMICLTGTTALIAGRLASHWYRIPLTPNLSDAASSGNSAPNT